MTTTSNRLNASAPRHLALCVLICLPGLPLSAVQAQTGLGWKDLVNLAVTHDPWQLRSNALASALLFEAAEVGELPDPRVSASLMNFPTDSFDFSQDPMTQVRFGITQRIPGGQSRKYRSQIKVLESEAQKLAQSARSRLVELRVTKLWLDLYLAHTTANLIRQDKPLFQQLIDVTSSSYRSASGRTNQQDLIRVQLELIRLDDRLLRLKNVQTSRRQEFAEWLPVTYMNTPIVWNLSRELRIEPQRIDVKSLERLLARHPELRLIDQAIETRRVALKLAKESTKPDWSMNASYAYRDEDRFGNHLADFISVGISFELPLFKKRRQDKHIAAAAIRVSADESNRLIRLHELQRRYLKAYASLESLDERLVLYHDSLLNQLDLLARASLNAYTADQGDFSDVMRAYIAVLNARIEVQTIEVNRLKILAEIRYLSVTQEDAA